MSKKSLVVFDSDSHVVEPAALWEHYLEPEYRLLGKHALWREEGKLGSYLKVNGKMFRDTKNPKIPPHAIRRPGMTWARDGEDGQAHPNRSHPLFEGASNAKSRLSDMNAMGIDQAFLYPTWFAEGFHVV